MLTLADTGGRAADAGFRIGPLILLLLGGLLIFMFVRRARRYGRGPWEHQMSPGLKVLDERYASGEIERDDYLAKREDLTSRPPRRDKKK